MLVGCRRGGETERVTTGSVIGSKLSGHNVALRAKRASLSLPDADEPWMTQSNIGRPFQKLDPSDNEWI
jgi:hypothetical protein